MHITRKLLIIFNILFCVSAEAYDCFSKNPRLSTPGNIYQSLNIKQQNKQQLQQIRHILNYLTSRWFDGSANRVVCRGQTPNINIQQQGFTVRSHTRHYPSDHFLLQLYMEDLQHQSSMTEHLRFYIRDNALRFTFESARGEIEIIRLDNNLLEFVTQHRHLGSITETHWSFQIQQQKLKIEKRIYGQGVLGEHMVWNLQRR